MINHKILIRRMEHKDIPQIRAIEQVVFSDPWSEESFIKAIKDKMDIYLIAENERGSILGYCGLWGVAGEGQITNVAVHPDYRRLGVAWEMLTSLIHNGRKAKLTEFTLEVRVSNHAAIKLYEKLGFKNVGIRKNFYSLPKEDAIIMWL